MPARRPRATFAEIVAEVEQQSASAAQARARHPHPRAGQFDQDHRLFDLGGRELHLVHPNLTASEALAAVEAGASVAWEGCGCGGYPGCQPVWVPVDRQRLPLAPPHLRPKQAPTWIDLWRGEDGDTVLLNGAVVWPPLLP